MPISLDPQAVFEAVLETDKTKNPPPTFVFRYLTYGQSLALPLPDEKTTDAEFAKWAIKIIRVRLTGWRNMIGLDGVEIAYDPDKLADILTVDELFELLRKSSLNKDDAKNSDAQLPPSGATAAQNAPADAGSTK